jgi:LysR family transcriptional activator of glutamate synthase operon
MDMDTDALRWFQQVADGTTVTEVSELEAVTQSGVSRALARLEAQIGTPLLRRHGRTLRLTQAGAVFKRHVDAMLHQLDDGIAAVSQLIEPDTGTVALAFQQSLGTWLVPDLVRSFRDAHPHVTFQLTQVRDEVHSAALDGGLADLEIGTRRARSAALRTRLIAIEPLRLAVQRDHPLAGQRIHLAQVSAEPFVSLRRSASWVTTCASRPVSARPWCSRGTTCPRCAGSWRPGWAWPSSPHRGRAPWKPRPGRWPTARSWTPGRSVTSP